MKKITFVVFILLLVVGCSSSKQSKGETLTSEEAYALVQANADILIVDVRTPEEFKEGHIANSINIPLDQLKEVAIKQLTDKKQKIFVVCRSGNRSSQAQDVLESMGYTNIIDVGSVFTWPKELVTNP